MLIPVINKECPLYADALVYRYRKTETALRAAVPTTQMLYGNGRMLQPFLVTQILAHERPRIAAVPGATGLGVAPATKMIMPSGSEPRVGTAALGAAVPGDTCL